MEGKTENENALLISLIKHEYDGECTRKEILRAKTTQFMTVTALIITASITMLIFCISEVKHPVFNGILFVFWVETALLSLFTLLRCVESQKNIGVACWRSYQLEEMWGEKDEGTLDDIFIHFKTMVNSLIYSNNKILEQNDNTRVLLLCSIILFIISFFVCILILGYIYII